MTSPARFVTLAATSVPVLLALSLHAQTDHTDCAKLKDAQLPNTTITTAQAITTGSFTPPGSQNAMSNLPPFCRVAGTIAPTVESDIRFEVWLPLDNWNGKFSGVGNGGWAGIISYGPLQDQIRRGYSDRIHQHRPSGGTASDGAKFAFDHPEQLIDFAYRAHHETTLKAKALVSAFYGKPPAKVVLVRLLVWRLRGPAWKRSASPPTTTASSQARPRTTGRG